MRKKFLFAALLICGTMSSLAEDKPKYKDASLPVEERVEDLLRRMTLHEKVLQLQNNSTSDINAIENTYKGGSPGSVHEMSMSAKDASLLFNKMQEYLLTQSRLGIPAMVTVEGINGVTQNGCTIFPQAIAQGSTFNAGLIEEMARAIGRESHVIGIRQLQCPVLDIARDLRWGRVEETFGEDPFLIGEMGTAFVRGSQAEGVGAMPKHFVAHGSPTGGLNCASVPGGERELRNLYAYPFAKVIKNAEPVSIMGCYSAYDGIPVAHSAHFMTDLLRGELGFKGFVYSDWGSVDRLKSFHFAAATSEEAARKALVAGIDMDVYDWAYQTLEDQVNKGILDEAYVDRACRRVLEAKFRLGMFDDPYGDPDKVDKVVRSKEHVALAKKVADESIVLLENKNGILPLDMKKYNSIALLGPNSNYGVAGDYGWVDFNHHECVTLFEGLKQAVGKDVQVNQLDGCDWWSQKEDGIAAAVELARKSDIAIVAVGTRSIWLGRGAKGKNVTSGEGFDLSSLELPGKQLELLKAVKATGKPVVVVLITGKPLVMTWAKEHADAVVLQFYGGEQQGNAMADVLLGKVNPSGHLNVSFPRSTGNAPCYYNYYPSDREQVFDQGGSYEEPNGHYVFEKPYALWNFGHGLSYTTFEYTDVALNDTIFSDQGKLRVTLKVKNTGKRDGKEVVQLYVRDKFSSVVTPIQQLKAFNKVEVPSGGETEVQLEMPIGELAFYNETLHRVVESGEFEVQIGHASDDIVFRKTIVVK
ncbi:glycoside hydrolase family 3 N-terminal domain-containing protein [Paraprevotella xylaniphila]|uniref:glycoside hydrolase family 3 N-terminal domain-containing protein n=1 Tax=Paraprevotella xylaniphila TaxID=454155 RepID=UPI0026DD71D6|nr:glycoside hydrolase family 3 N-terminal domain-containing protein [Paraprevotella xylaniphila]